jgi:integrase/recombinase XerD
MVSLRPEVEVETDAFPDFMTVAGIRQNWLKDRITSFLIDFVAQGYKPQSLQEYARRLRGFGKFAESRGVTEPTQLADHIESFVGPICIPKLQRVWRNFLKRFAVSQPVESTFGPIDPQSQLVEEYVSFLREHRGLKPKTVSRTRTTCMKFLAFIAADGCSDLAGLRPESIHRFIVTQGKRYSRVSLRHCCGEIRGFLVYLYRHRVLGSDLSLAVISPRVYKHEQCPRFLTRAEVESVFAAIDRSNPRGKRSYAMLLLLATYGLRGGEVSSLRLDDIDWHNDRIRIANRKAGNSTDYPLTAAVGEAILDYLTLARPVSSHRELFLRIIAPVGPITSTSPIVYQAKKYMKRVGVTVMRPGSHSFRYSCAQRLLDGGMSLKTIGDYLGHSHPDSTQRYTKIAIDQLREVARGDVEELL